MKISGFTFVRNAIDLYYPVVEAITSILPICDELIVAAGDSTGGTTELLRRIDDPKQTAHGWYRREVRTGIGVRSWKSAQGFRRDGQKLHVALANAEFFHYGWVRPPRLMTRKDFALSTVHAGVAEAQAAFPNLDVEFDYGRLWGRARFTGTHPQVMAKRIAEMHWEVKPTRSSRHRQDKIGNRILSFIENRILGYRLGEHRNYVLLRS